MLGPLRPCQSMKRSTKAVQTNLLYVGKRKELTKDENRGVGEHDRDLASQSLSFHLAERLHKTSEVVAVCHIRYRHLYSILYALQEVLGRYDDETSSKQTNKDTKIEPIAPAQKETIGEIGDSRWKMKVWGNWDSNGNSGELK